jgi:chorismate dehydratase
LGLAWKAMTGLPFVFAAWISNKKIPAEFIDAFNRANALGLNSLDDIAEQQQYKSYDLHQYYTENISYRLDEHKKEGMKLFMNKIIVNRKLVKQNS